MSFDLFIFLPSVSDEPRYRAAIAAKNDPLLTSLTQTDQVWHTAYGHTDFVSVVLCFASLFFIAVLILVFTVKQNRKRRAFSIHCFTSLFRLAVY